MRPYENYFQKRFNLPKNYHEFEMSKLVSIACFSAAAEHSTRKVPNFILNYPYACAQYG